MLRSRPLKYKPGIATMSLGRAFAGHSLPHKLSCAALNGFHGIELFFEDLEYVAKDLPDGLTPENKIAAGKLIRKWCDERGLGVICLQPFMHYEGLRDEKEHEEKLEELKVWFDICDVLGTDIVQIPSSFLPTERCSGGFDVIVGDLREVADMGLNRDRPIRFVYESLCWGTWVDTWEECWDIVSRVDRPNFGICLDTFNIAGRVWADPADASGKNANADEALMASLKRMRNTIDVAKIFYIEVVDAERLDKPLIKDHPWHDDAQKPRMSWSRNARLFPFEEKAYLPIMEVLKTIVNDVAFEGWVSFEFFSRTLTETHVSVPEEHGSRAGLSWIKLCNEMGWDDGLGGEDGLHSPNKVPAEPQTFARL